MTRDAAPEAQGRPAHDYVFAQRVLFRHCDPAGLVFYPRFFEMMNDAVEALFRDRLGWPFERMHPDHGVPTAAVDVAFHNPCRHGDTLDLCLSLDRIGRTSLALCTRAYGGPAPDDLRFEARQTLVCIEAGGQPMPWPDAVRRRMTDCMEARA